MDAKREFFLPFQVSILAALIAFFSLNESYGQSLSMDLSIEWKKSDHHLKESVLMGKSPGLTPFLRIVYRNHTGKKICIRKMTNEGCYPPVIIASLENTTQDMSERALGHLDYEGKNYRVILEPAWEVIGEGVDYMQEHEMDVINDDLFEIYTVLEMQRLLDRSGANKQLSCFDYPRKEVITYRQAQQLVSAKVDSTNFILLDKGKQYSEEFDLTGFLIVKGNFTFSNPGRFKDTVLVGEQNVVLPKNLNGYELYLGNIVGDSVTVNFER